MDSFSKLSFIGFSMGGIIARGTVKNLGEYHQRLGFFITLSSPHIGLSIVQNFLFNFGFFFMKAIRKNDSAINELSLKDQKNIVDTKLFKLSLDDSLKNFKNVIFIGSYEDHYSPYESSLVAKGKVLSKPSADI